MTEKELLNKALMLEQKTYGMKNQLLLLRTALFTMERKLENLNDDEAKAIWERYWHQHRQEFKVLKNLSRHEIYQVVRNRETVRNVCRDLLRAGQNLSDAALKIRAWKHKIELATKTYELYKKMKNQRQRKDFQNVISQINDMQEAQKTMQLAMNIMNGLARQYKYPFVTEMVNLYVTIFDELCRFCDKIADYAKTLELEAEKALGAKSGWNRVLNGNSVLSRESKTEYI